MTTTNLFQVSMTSLRIADITGKAHKHVLDDCRGMFEDLGVSAAEFSATEVYYTGRNQSQRREREYFDLPKDLVNTLVLGYDTARRYAVIKELEAKTAALMAIRDEATTIEEAKTISAEALIVTEGREQLRIEHPSDTTVVEVAHLSGTYLATSTLQQAQIHTFNLVCKVAFGEGATKFKKLTGLSPRDYIVETLDVKGLMTYTQTLSKVLMMIECGFDYEDIKARLLK